MAGTIDDHEAVRRARELLLAEHPEIREEYERMQPRFEAAAALIRARRAAGITQAELAERMGRRQSLVSEIESGRRSPRVDTLADAARALGCDLRIEFVPHAPGPSSNGRAGRRA